VAPYGSQGRARRGQRGDGRDPAVSRVRGPGRDASGGGPVLRRDPADRGRGLRVVSVSADRTCGRHVAVDVRRAQHSGVARKPGVRQPRAGPRRGDRPDPRRSGPTARRLVGLPDVAADAPGVRAGGGRSDSRLADPQGAGGTAAALSQRDRRRGDVPRTSRALEPRRGRHVGSYRRHHSRRQAPARLVPRRAGRDGARDRRVRARVLSRRDRADDPGGFPAADGGPDPVGPRPGSGIVGGY